MDDEQSRDAVEYLLNALPSVARDEVIEVLAVVSGSVLRAARHGGDVDALEDFLAVLMETLTVEERDQ